MRGFWLWMALVLAGLTCGACSSDDETIKEWHDYADAEGRTCRATLEKTSPGTPSVKQSVRCQGEPRACSGESDPCFVLSVDTETDDIRNCPACCTGNSSSFLKADCTQVVCTTDAECVYPGAKCRAGSCTCPSGYCE